MGDEDEQILRKVQPGFTSDVDKHYTELAYWILNKAGHVNIGDPALKSLKDAKEDYQLAKEDYESDPSIKNNVKMVKAEIEMIKAETAEIKANRRSTKMEPSKEMKSPTLGIKTTTGGLKTRRRKHRNGPSRIRRHRSQRVSSRKVKA